MSIAINAQLFTRFESQLDALREDVDEGCMESIQKQTARLTKTLAEMRGTAGAAPAEPAEPAKKARKSKLNADGTEKAKRVRVPRDPNAALTPHQNLVSNLISPLWKKVSAEDKKILAEKSSVKPKGFNMLAVAGYLHHIGKDEATEDDMAAAVIYLKEHPEYTSKTQVSRSGSASQASASEQAEKKPRRRRQAKKAAAAPAEAPAVHVSDIVAQIEAHIAEEESDDESEDDEEENERVPLESWDWKGAHYLKDPFQEVYTAEGEMEWVGTFTGKKITKGDMPARVKAFIASQE